MIHFLWKKSQMTHLRMLTVETKPLNLSGQSASFDDSFGASFHTQNEAQQ
jgi:hypothetical protein